MQFQLNPNQLLGICFWREGLEAALGPELRGEKGGWYGAKPGHVSSVETAADPRQLYQGDDPTFANNCVLARRLVENGVRFVQLYDWGWDHHGSSPGESIDETLPIKCQQIDRAIAGLIKDLKQRGLFEETLIVWGGGIRSHAHDAKQRQCHAQAGFLRS